MQKEQWQAIMDCDASFNGKFFYAVKTTHIFCRPSCKSRPPKQDNVLIFLTVVAAMDAGFRACKRCRPDQYRLPMEELAHHTMDYIDRHYKDPLTLGNLAKSLHTSPYHIHHIFKRINGMTPIVYLQRKRMVEAKKLLENTELRITEVAMTVGFANIAHFTTVFKNQVGQTPSAYRTQCQTAMVTYSDWKEV